MSIPQNAGTENNSISTVTPALPVSEPDDDMQLVVLRPLPKPFFKDPDTGKTQLEKMFFMQLIIIAMLCTVLYSFITLPPAILDQELGFCCTMLILAVASLIFRFLPIRLAMNKQGLFVGAATFAAPKDARRRRKWEDLDCVRFQKASGMADHIVMSFGRSDYLVFDFKTTTILGALPYNSTSYVNIGSLKSAEREKLFAALSRFVPQELLAPEVLYLQVKSLSGEKNENLNDYTQVWLEEYNRHFEISNYVTLAPGSKCGAGRFTISMTIAARINCSTYLAINNNGAKVVIKELVAPVDSDDAMQQKLLAQFNREAAILAELNHPAIVSVIDHFIENGRSYIVMQCVQGRNIREHVRLHGCLKEAEAISIGRQLASVLQYLHHHSPPILHRDFTPDNLIYSSDGTITVIDFGAANVFNTGKTATLIGKQSYMPPEQLRGKPAPASDIYAFGATLSYLLTARDLAGIAKLPESLMLLENTQLLQLIQKCLSMEIDERPNADQLLASLEELQAGLSTDKAKAF